MPAMLRMNKKYMKIAFHILGVPSNYKDIVSKEKAYINKRLIADETYRVR